MMAEITNEKTHALLTEDKKDLAYVAGVISGMKDN